MTKFISNISKNLKVLFSNSTWKKKALWLTSDYPQYTELKQTKFIFKKLDMEISPNKFEFLLDGFEYLRQLNELGGFSFSIVNDVIVAKGEKFTVEIHAAEELFILREICLGKDYNFQPIKDVIVIDIGMNVGLASLYFASRDDVEYVYGFEPFKPTYQQCMRNLAKNENLAQKITTNNFGLSDGEKYLKVNYDFNNKGQVGIYGTELIRSTVKLVQEEKIELRPILPEVEKVVEQHPEMDLVCKIDCEGGEYDIFKSFSEYGIPEAVKIIMMEWHKNGPEQLLETLRHNNFESIATYTYRQDVGMIYAFRA